MRAYATTFFYLPIVTVEPGDLTIFLSDSGDLACHLGILNFVRDEENGRFEYDYKSMVTWRKEAGQWKVVANSWSPNTA